MTEPTDSRPDRAGDAVRAACDDRVRTRRHRPAAGRRPARGGAGLRRRGARRARDDGRRVGGDGGRAARHAARPAARRPSTERPGASSCRPQPHESLAHDGAGRGGGGGRSGSAPSASGMRCGPRPATSTAEQIFAAPDVRTVSGDIPGRRHRDAWCSPARRTPAVLVMNNVAPPKPGTVYQMWLVGDNGPQSAGTMDAKAVAPSTTAVLPDLGDSQALAFTVEPGGGSAMPTSPGVRRTAAGLTESLQRRGRRLGEHVVDVVAALPGPPLAHRAVADFGDTGQLGCTPCRSRRPSRARAGRDRSAGSAGPAQAQRHGFRSGRPRGRRARRAPTSSTRPRSACGASGGDGSRRAAPSSSAVITAPLTNAASRTVSATVAGTSATRTSTVGKFADGRTSQ